MAYLASQISYRNNEMASNAYRPCQYSEDIKQKLLQMSIKVMRIINVEEWNVSTDVPNVDQASVPPISSMSSTANRHPNSNSQKLEDGQKKSYAYK